MPWFRVDDQIAFHRKILRAGNEAFGAWVRMGAQSSAEMLDGLVTRETALTIAGDPMVIDRLVTAKLLEVEGDDYRVHDFLDYNPSANETRKLRKARANAGSVGGSNRQATKQASAQAVATPVASALRKQNDTPSRPDPVPIPREREGARAEVGYVTDAEHRSSVPLRQIPSDLKLDAAFEGVAAECMLTDVPTVFASFKAHHESKGTLSLNWLAEWRKWCAREKNIQARDRQRAREPGYRPEPKPPPPGGMSPRVRKAGDEKPAPRPVAATLGRALLDTLEGVPVLPHVPGQMLQTSETPALEGKPETRTLASSGERDGHDAGGIHSRRAEAPESAPSFDLVDSDPAPDFDQRGIDDDEAWLRTAMGES